MSEAGPRKLEIKLVSHGPALPASQLVDRAEAAVQAAQPIFPQLAMKHGLAWDHPRQTVMVTLETSCSDAEARQIQAAVKGAFERLCGPRPPDAIPCHSDRAPDFLRLEAPLPPTPEMAARLLQGFFTVACRRCQGHIQIYFAVIGKSGCCPHCGTIISVDAAPPGVDVPTPLPPVPAVSGSGTRRRLVLWLLLLLVLAALAGAGGLALWYCG
jgi:ribosomal protein S27E